MSQSLDRALRLLPLLARGPATLEQAARHLGAHKSTALRLLRTLAAHGIVYRQDDYRYRLGAQLFALAREAVEQLDIREVARPHLVRLSQLTGHTVHLTARQEDEVRYIDKVASRYPARMRSRVGGPVAMTAAAAAKIMLADLPRPHRQSLLRQLDYPRYTARSITSPGPLLAELDTVREQGWAGDFGGHQESINCLAAPIRSHDGRVVAALSLSVPAARASTRALLALLPQVRRAAGSVTGAYTGQTPTGGLPPGPLADGGGGAGGGTSGRRPATRGHRSATDHLAGSAECPSSCPGHQHHPPERPADD